MKFYGIQKTTLIDYPKHIATTLFTAGCNMRCPFCHNPELLGKNSFSQIDDSISQELIFYSISGGSKESTVGGLKYIEEDEIFEHIEKRKNILEAICITGGEPLLNGQNLINFIEKVKKYGLKVKIDTNGLLPEVLEKINCDYVAMDIKTSLKKYPLLYPKYDDFYERIIKSIEIITKNFSDYEFRTTVVPTIVDIEDIKEIAKIIPKRAKYFLNQFRPLNTLDSKYSLIKPYDNYILEEMKKILVENQISCEIRANYNHSKDTL